MTKLSWYPAPNDFLYSTQIKEFMNTLIAEHPCSCPELIIRFVSKPSGSQRNGVYLRVYSKTDRIIVGYKNPRGVWSLDQIKWILAHEYMHVIQAANNTINRKSSIIEAEADKFADTYVGFKYTKEVYSAEHKAALRERVRLYEENKAKNINNPKGAQL